MEQSRRSTDLPPDGFERLVRLEKDVEHIEDIINDANNKFENHQVSTDKSFAELRLLTQELVVQAKVQVSVLDRALSAIEVVSKHETRVASLEEFRKRTETHTTICDADRLSMHDQIRTTSEKVDRLYWLAPILFVIVQVGWTLLTHFHII